MLLGLGLGLPYGNSIVSAGGGAGVEDAWFDEDAAAPMWNDETGVPVGKEGE